MLPLDGVKAEGILLKDGWKFHTIEILLIFILWGLASQALANLAVPDFRGVGGGINLPIAQRIGTPAIKQPQRIQLQKKTLNPTGNKNQPNKKPLVSTATQNKQINTLQKNAPSTNSPTAVTNKQMVTKANMQPNAKHVGQSQQNKKCNVLQRLGTRFNVHKQFHQRTPHPRPNPTSPRFNGPRTPQFQNSGFMEPRMRFPPSGPPMNEMRMPGPPFQEPHPSLLPFRIAGERAPFNQFMFEPNRPRFRMQGPGFRNFRPMGMDMFPDRFPPPHFPPNQMPPVRQFEPNNQMFQRPRFHGSNMRQKSNSNSNENKNSTEKIVISPSKETQKRTKQNSNQVQNILCDSENSTSHSVLVENLSSSTNEMQLKKLCTSVGVVE
ncbi:RRM domain-containing protein, partial [Trichonephila clavata]